MIYRALIVKPRPTVKPSPTASWRDWIPTIIMTAVILACVALMWRCDGV